MISIHHGDCLEIMKTLPDNSVDAIVTDPPYGLSFMGKHWDYDVPTEDIWREALRVLKPGGHLLSFFGTRTYHRGVVRIEDAGFEIRDQIMWIYGSGFPKSHNIDKAIDKMLGAEREVVCDNPNHRKNELGETHKTGTMVGEPHSGNGLITAPKSDQAKQWQGWGTALKPANEPIVVARKPLEKGLTVAENVLKWGTGAINVDESRIASESMPKSCTNQNIKGNSYKSDNSEKVRDSIYKPNSQGRWPANIIFDEDAASMLDEQAPKTGGRWGKKTLGDSNSMFGVGGGYGVCESSIGDIGGASRFFYVAKASKSERNAGLEGMPKIKRNITNGHGRGAVNTSKGDGTGIRENRPSENFHPTVKPIKLMQYLIKLVTPPNGTVLDPFMGSGSTGVAAKNLGFNFIGCEMNEEYFEIAKTRLGI